jgi:hypothetical protein
MFEGDDSTSGYLSDTWEWAGETPYLMQTVSERDLPGTDALQIVCDATGAGSLPVGIQLKGRS